MAAAAHPAPGYRQRSLYRTAQRGKREGLDMFALCRPSSEVAATGRRAADG
jgi:hypothetical protein